MELSEIRKLCLALPGVTEDIKWEHHLCFNIGDKMFMITSPDEVPVNASFKVSEENFRFLTIREGVQPAPYLARYHWVKVDRLDRLSSAEWKKLIPEAYNLIASRLPKTLKRKLGLE